MDKIKYLRIQEQGSSSYSQDIPIGANAADIDMLNGNNLQNTIGNLDHTIDGSITQNLNNHQTAINQLDSNKLDKTDVVSYVHTEVTDWLDDNVTPVGSAVTVDNSLSIQGAAADAKIVGDELSDLKSDLSYETQSNIEFFEDEFGITNYIFKYNENKAVATSVDPVNLDEATLSKPNTSPWKYCIIPCVEGDKFHVHITEANSTYRPWAFVQDNGTKISVANSNLVDEDLTAPENAAYLVCNVRISSDSIIYRVTKGINKIAEVEKNEERISNFYGTEVGVRYYKFESGTIPTTTTSVDPTVITPSTNGIHCIVPCITGDVFKLSAGNGTTNRRPWSFIDDTNAVISQATVNNVSDALLMTPVGATKLVLNTDKTYDHYCYKYDNRITAVETELNYSNTIIGKEIGKTPCLGWKHGYIKTDAVPVDITAVVATTNWIHLVVPCVFGDVFALNISKGTTSARPYAIIDSSGNVLDIATQNAFEGDITIPENAAYLICNVRLDEGLKIHEVSKGVGTVIELDTKVANVEAKIDDIVGLTSPYQFLRGRIKTNVSPIDVTSVETVTNEWCYCVTDCEEGEIYNIYVPNATTAWRPWTFIDSSGNVISQAKKNKVNARLITPAGAVKLVCNSYGSDATLTKGVDRLNEWKEHDRYKNLLGIFRIIGVVGDSLASGQGRINDLDHYHDFYDYSWPQQMKRMLGNEIYNFTKSGLSSKTWLTDSMGWPLASDGSHKAQCYIIGLGANDTGRVESDPTYLGSESDVHVDDYTQNPDTYYGNYGRIISLLKTIEPRAFFFVLPNPVYGGTASIRAQMNEAVKYMSTAFENVYYVPLDGDLYSGGYIDSNEVKSHYTPGAYLYMANYLLSTISQIIYDNSKDFLFVNLIGTEYDTPELP